MLMANPAQFATSGEPFKGPKPVQLGNTNLNLDQGMQMQSGQMATNLPPMKPEQMQETKEAASPTEGGVSQLQKNMVGFLKTDEGQSMLNDFYKNGHSQYERLILQQAGKAPPTSGTVNPASAMMYKSGLASTPFSNSSPQNSPVQNRYDAQNYLSLLNNPLNQANQPPSY